VTLDNGRAVFWHDTPNSCYFYGPISATTQVNNAGGSPGTPQKIYLTASGMNASDVTFTATNSIGSLLPTEAMYGSDEIAPYVTSGDDFYLKVSDTSSALINPYQPSNVNFQYLALHGFGKADDVEYRGTPAIMAWQDPSTGEQDWEHVQAFIGFVNNMQASLYGEGHLLIQGNNDNASITLEKKVLGEGAADTGSFVFTLEVHDNALNSWVPVPLVPGVNISGASGLDNASPSGVFSLANGDSVSITGLPLGEYRVSEQASVDGYTATYQLASSSVVEGFSAEVLLNPVTASRMVTFTNTVTPKTPEVPVVPDEPETPGGPEGPDEPNTVVPATGDRGLPLAVLAIVLTAGGAAALLYRQARRLSRGQQLR
jgi:hypothetical protein